METVMFCEFRKARERNKRKKQLQDRKYIMIVMCIVVTLLVLAVLALEPHIEAVPSHADELTESEAETVLLHTDELTESEAETVLSYTEELAEAETATVFSNEVPCQTPKTNADYGYVPTEEEKILMANVVYEEARGEEFNGKVLIAAIILNRYFEGSDVDFTRESIYSIITQPGQMADGSSVKVEYMDEEQLKVYAECMRAVEVACDGENPSQGEIFPQGALFWFNPEKVNGYQALIRTGIDTVPVGNHLAHNEFNWGPY